VRAISGRLCVGLTLLALVPAHSLAVEPCQKAPKDQESATKQPPSGLNWLAQYVKIAKSYSGTAKDSHSPASLVFESANPGGSDTAVDVAVKGKVGDFCWGPTYENIGPTVEWHRSTLEQDRVNKLGVDVTLVSWVVLSPQHDHIGSDLRYKVARDFVAVNNPNSASWHIYYFGGVRPGLWPGVHWRPAPDREEVFSYLPNIGIEHYSKLQLKEQQFGQPVVLAPAFSGSFYSVALNFFVNPFADTLSSQLTLTGTATWRDKFAGDAGIPGNSSLVLLSLTYFFDRSRTFGFGVDYQSGRDPDRNFLNEGKTSVGLKFQIGK